VILASFWCMSDAPVPQGFVIDPAAPARRLTVVQLLPALENGGAERSTLEVARALVAVGHRSVVISAGGRMVRQLEAEGSEHVTLDIATKSLWAVTRIGRLRRSLTAIGPDIVHARSRMPAWLAWLALRGMRPKPGFVTTVHGLNSPGAWSGIMIRGDRVIAVSQSVRDFVLGHYPRVDATKLTVIPRGIDPEAFPYGYRPEAGWREAFFKEYPQLAGAPLLTLPGRGTRLKGHADAIALVAGLRERGIDARLLLLGIAERGREAYLREMQQLAETRGVADIVVFSPPRNDVRDVFAVSDLVLQLSNKPESFGRTVIEALSLCRPVLGYAHGGVGELLAELYPAGRVAVGDVDKLIVRAAELLGRAPPIAPLQRYHLSDMQAAVLALYEELAATLRDA
jgi:glycosyltransferase involved in cell wall biosynthesis